MSTERYFWGGHPIWFGARAECGTHSTARLSITRASVSSWRCQPENVGILTIWKTQSLPRKTMTYGGWLRNPAPVGIWFIPLSPHYLQCFIVTYRLPTGAGFLPSTVCLQIANPKVSSNKCRPINEGYCGIMRCKASTMTVESFI